MWQVRNVNSVNFDSQLRNKITLRGPSEPCPAFSLVHQKDLWGDFRHWYLILWWQIQWNQACNGWVCLAPDVGDVQSQKRQSENWIYTMFLIVKQALQLSGFKNSRVPSVWNYWEINTPIPGLLLPGSYNHRKFAINLLNSNFYSVLLYHFRRLH